MTKRWDSSDFYLSVEKETKVIGRRTAQVTRVTRGYGLLEGFLAEYRATIANRLTPASCRQGGKILDVGCGTYPFFLLGTEFSEKYGLDRAIDSGALKDFESKGLFLRRYDLEAKGQLPFTDEFFDVVTMLAVFEHITPALLPDLIREIYRVLRFGGSHIITTPAGWTDRLLRILSCLGLVSATEIEDHKDTYTSAKIVSILEKGGFTGDSIRCGHFELGMNIWVKAEK